MNVIGNKKTLLSMHGQINVDKAIEAIECMSELTDLDISTVNNTSETGALFIGPNGRIFDTYKDSDERIAKYKIVPLGIKLKYTNYPLFASFIKLNAFWEGAFIGTGIQLFEMYKQHYNGSVAFCDTYKDIFGGDNKAFDIKGFGLVDVLNNKNESIETFEYKDKEDSSNSVSNALAAALEKLNKDEVKDTKKRGAHLSKNQRKAARLQAHLDKMKDKEQRELAKKQNKAINSIEDVEWFTVTPLGESTVVFEDKVTKEFNERVRNYLNSGSDNYTAVNTSTTYEYIESGNADIQCADENSLKIIEEMDHDNIDSECYEKEKYKVQMKLGLIHEIYDKLLIKENWMVDNNRNRLGFYLKGICIFIWKKQRESSNIRGNGYLYSDNKQKCVINTGLIDNYGNYVYLIDHTPAFPNFYDKQVSLMDDKVALLNFGFNITEVRHLPEPIKFVEDTHELLFKASMEDFDLDDENHLRHIIKERIERFPKKYRGIHEWVLCEKIKTAIRQAIKISDVDYRYVLPKYDFSRECIQFLMPLYLENTPEESPELTLVVGKYKGLWQIYTVLYPQDAYDDARLICKPSDTWLNIHKNK